MTNPPGMPDDGTAMRCPTCAGHGCAACQHFGWECFIVHDDDECERCAREREVEAMMIQATQTRALVC